MSEIELLAKGLSSSLSSLCDLVTKLVTKPLKLSREARYSLLKSANDLSSAISMTCLHSTARLNNALLLERASEKLLVVSQLGDSEIKFFSEVNHLCLPLQQSIVELNKLFTIENISIEFQQKQDILRLFEALKGGEVGLQELFSEMMNVSNFDDHNDLDRIDEQIKEILRSLQEISAMSSQFTSKIATIM